MLARRPSSWLLYFAVAASSCEAQRDPNVDREAGPRGDPATRRDVSSSIHAPFDEILAANVRDERVDYLAIRDDHFDELESYLDVLAKVDPKKLRPDERLAFYINLYNATMIHTIATRVVDGYTVGEDEWGVFKEPLVRSGGERISLNELENEVVRKEFTEPRIHVALVCGARSCPPILARAYEGQDLETVLEANMVHFVNDSSRNELKGGEARLSQIFNWYGDDFGGSRGVAEYVSRYAKTEVGRAEPKFLDYSWDLNLAVPKGRWVVVQRAMQGLRKAEIVKVVGEEGDQLIVRKPRGAGTIRVARSASRDYEG